jgi:hypothetical protein
MVLLTEDIYETGTLLTFSNPLSYKDPNLSGATLNQFGATSITGENTYSTSEFKFISHTDPMTGKRLRTRYFISGASQSENQFLRFPTNTEYFQVVTSMTYSNFAQLQLYDPGMESTSLWNRVLRTDQDPANDFVTSHIFKIEWNTGAFQPSSFQFNPFRAYTERGGTIVTILMRGVDPHSIKQKTKIFI